MTTDGQVTVGQHLYVVWKFFKQFGRDEDGIGFQILVTAKHIVLLLSCSDIHGNLDA